MSVGERHSRSPHAVAEAQRVNLRRTQSHLGFDRYLKIIAIIWIITVGTVFSWPKYYLNVRPDHLGFIPLRGDYSWYLDFGGTYVPEIEDEDLYYHNIGSSIADAKKADIIFLGPSFVAFAVEPELLRQFGERHGIRLYNMSFIGIRGGEFSREVIKRWDLHPKLWVINADDQFVHFFSRSLDLTIGPQTVDIPAAKYNRLRGWLAVAARDLRWRIEYGWAAWPTESLSRQPAGIYRRPEDGSVYLPEVIKNYDSPDNPVLHVARDQNCHAGESTIDFAQGYLKDIGGQTILMLVPHSQYCPEQARELAKALRVELITPPNTDYTTVDGGHLDHKGATAFTQFILSTLQQSEPFKRLFPSLGSGS